MVDHDAAFGIMGQLVEAMSAGEELIDMRDLATRQREAPERL
jgi:hypothetical protein